MELLGLFKDCGLTETEAKIMILLSKSRNLQASKIAKLTQIKRTTVYAALSALESEHLVVSQRKNKVHIFNAIEPKLIEEVLTDRARDRLSKVKNASSDLSKKLTEVKSSSNQIVNTFELNTVSSTIGLMSLLDEFLLSGSFKGIFNPQKTMHDPKIRESMLKYFDITAKTKVNIQEVLVRGEDANWYVSKIKNPNHQIKQIDSTPRVITDMIIKEDKVAILNYEQDEQIGITINQRNFSMTMDAIFDIFWSSL